MKPLPWLLALALLAGLVLVGRDGAFAKSEARRWQRTADSLAVLSRKADTVFVHRRDTLYRRVTRLDSVAVEVERWKTDTLRVVEFVALADSTARACLATVSACEAQVSLRDERIAALQSQLRAVEAQRPTLRDKARTALVWGGIGYLAGRARIP